MKFVPVLEPDLSGNELRYLTECIQSSWISSTGRFVTEFEDGFTEYCASQFGVAVSNGTVALHLALLALEIGPGDEVIVPDVTFAASANAVIHAGAMPVLADIDPQTWNLNPVRVEELITPRTRAVMPVHLYGNPCDMDAFALLKERYGVAIIEDAAEAHGARYKGRPVGSFGDVNTFSFFGNKTITSGEGGMCLTNDRELYERMRVLRDHGMNPNRRYWHEVVGYNYRMTNLQAAVGVAQIERIGEFIRHKRRVAETYKANLDANLFTFAAEHPEAESIPWLTTVLLPEAADREAVISSLRDQGIDSRPMFFPLHMMPAYKHLQGAFPVSEQVALRGLSLPSSVTLSEEDVVRIAQVAQEIVQATLVTRGTVAV